jgi:nicotinamidase-related amidase
MNGKENGMVRGFEPGRRAALVISECQQAQTLDELRGVRDDLARSLAQRGVLSAIGKLAREFRDHGLPVVHGHMVPDPQWQGFGVNCVLAGVLKRTDVLKEGHRGAEPNPDLLPEPGDLVVRRRIGFTMFHGTELDQLLRNLDVGTVVLAGVSLNVALLGSAIEAANLGYQVVLPTDCAAGVGPAPEVLLEHVYPLLATVTDSGAVAEALRDQEKELG